MTKKDNYQYLKNRDFHCPAYPIIFYMPHWWPMYLFWKLSNSCFCAGQLLAVSAQLFYTGFCSASKQPNPQPKKILLFPSSRLLDQIYIYINFHMMIFTVQEDTVVVVKQLKNLDEGNLPKLLQDQRILPNLQLWQPMVIFFF